MLRIDIRRSPILAGLLMLAHGAVLGLMFTLALPWWAEAVSVLAIGLSATHAIALHAWQRLGTSIVALELAEDCGVNIRRRNGEWQDADLLASTFVAPYLTVLNLRVQGARRLTAVIIVPDRVDGEAFRRLRMWLRWRCAGAEPEEKKIV